MTVGANSYGTTAGVAGYVPLYTDPTAKLFTAFTTPSITNVESWIDQVSAIANSALSAAGFTTPITHTDAVQAIAGLVEQLVADLCHASRSSGRFFSERSQNSSLSAMGQLRTEIFDWVENNTRGFEEWGIERNVIGGRKTAQAGVVALDFADHNAGRVKLFISFVALPDVRHSWSRFHKHKRRYQRLAPRHKTGQCLRYTCYVAMPRQKPFVISSEEIKNGFIPRILDIIRSASIKA